MLHFCVLTERTVHMFFFEITKQYKLLEMLYMLIYIHGSSVRFHPKQHMPTACPVISVRNAYLCVRMTVYNCVHNTTLNSSDNLPFYLPENHHNTVCWSVGVERPTP